MIHRYSAFLLLALLVLTVSTQAAAQPGPEKDSLKGKKSNMRYSLANAALSFTAPETTGRSRHIALPTQLAERL